MVTVCVPFTQGLGWHFSYFSKLYASTVNLYVPLFLSFIHNGLHETVPLLLILNSEEFPSFSRYRISEPIPMSASEAYNNRKNSKKHSNLLIG